MFYENKIKQKNIRYKKVNYASFVNGINSDYDEKILPVRYATSTYNYSYLNGALRTGLGVKELSISYDRLDRSKKKSVVLPDGVEAIATYTYIRQDKFMGEYMDMLLVYASDCKIYAYSMYFDSDSFFVLDQVLFSTIPLVVNYNIEGKDCVIFVTEEEGMFVWDGESHMTKIDDAPSITSMCIHYERMFATVVDDARSICFSDDLNPTNWAQSLTEGGFVSIIDERGSSKKIISFNDYLYIFRDYGIDRMVAYADQTGFQINPLFTSSTKIYTDTIRVCGDRIVFLAEDGIYYFSGLSTTKYDLNINSKFVGVYNDKAKASYYNGKYYLACRMKFDEDMVGCESVEFDNNCLLELDLKTGGLNILRGYDIINLQTLNSRIESKLVICVKVDGVTKLGELSNDGEVFGKSTHKMWRSPKLNFDEPLRDKLIKSLTLSSSGDVTIRIRYDNNEKDYRIKGSNNLITIYPNIKGKEIAVDFLCDKSGCNISNPEMIIGVL